ncbi:MAG: hypothetical protein PWP28_2437 [Oceanotoga sp.]|jgi:hypothetical protein|uniref:Type I phosphodiesterase/nucleotide pyrophosphatase n=2 Tax=Petrotogaceae TaxID=1643949 RepID=A0AA45HIP3_9BACT|nr:hypothetical protein [Oceanotoga sp.]PWJ95075.1 type I phosphodiesterase/nucleotide pyrophosphatase [Oceanotoga teriensis]
MRGKTIIIIIILIILMILSFIGGLMLKKNNFEFIPNIQISGDVQNPVDQNILKSLNIQNIEIDKKDYKSILLNELIEIAKPLENEYDVYFYSASSDKVIKISDKYLKESLIVFDKDNGLTLINVNHSQKTNINNLNKIIIKSAKNEFNEIGLNIIEPENNILKLTPANALLDYSYDQKFEIENIENIENNSSYKSTIYEKKDILNTEKIPNIKGNRTLIISSDGESVYYKDGFIEINQNSFDYISNNGQLILKNIKGIILNSPVYSVKDAYTDSVHYIKQDKNVLIIIISGLGYHDYLKAINDGYAPFLAEKNVASRALTVFKPEENTGMAAIITGKSPNENKIYDNSYKKIYTPDIFEYLSKFGMTSAYIEGNNKILDTSIEPIITKDLNQNLQYDDETFQKTIENLDKNFIISHFHSIEEESKKSDTSYESIMNQMKIIDDYIKQIYEQFDGKIIITSDYGIYNGENGPKFGQMRYENMFVPYLILE